MNKGTAEKAIEKTGGTIDKGVDTGVKVTKGFFKRLKEGWKKDKGQTGKFEIYKDKKGEYRFRLKAANGEVIAVGESYKSKASCEDGIDSVKRNASEAELVDLTKIKRNQ